MIKNTEMLFDRESASPAPDFYEEAVEITRLMRAGGYTQECVAKKLGKTQSAISNKLRLLKLGDNMISKILSAGLTERHARALLRLNTREERNLALSHITENELTVSQADEYIDALLSRKNARRHELRRQSRQQSAIEDVRLFYNTISHAAETIRRAGLRTDIARDEDETSFFVSIKIFK